MGNHFPRKLMIFVLVLILAQGVAGGAAAAGDYEYAWFPAPRMQISQLAYESYSHHDENAIDLNAGGGDLVAPFTAKVVYLDARWGYVVLQSVDKVYWADGTCDYMTVAFMHDEDISNLTKGQILKQGTPFYQDGGQGARYDGNGALVGYFPDVYSDHVHLSIYKGRTNGITGKRYGAGNVYAFDAFYVNREVTVKTSGRGEGYLSPGNTVAEGAPDDWRGLWRYLEPIHAEHSYEPTLIGPTCTGAGYTLYLCECGDSYREAPEAALGHDWDAGVVTREPTVDAEGEKTVTCTACGQKQTESIPKIQETQPEDALRGDVNGDGKINPKDAAMILQHFVDKPLTNFSEAAADVNSDGKINPKDAAMVLQHFVGKLESLG